jgi:predicted dehydrogenase
VGGIHARVLKTLDQSEFCAVCDVSPSRAIEFAREFHTAAHTDVAQMVGKEGIEAVAICTPHPLHAEAAIAAMEAGANVLIEKPLAANLTDCDRILGAAARNRKEGGVVSQRRFFTPVLRIKAVIDAGKIGRPILGTVQMFSWRDAAYYASDPWRGKWATEGGGVLVNQSPHHLDLLMWLMGPVVEVIGYAANLGHPTVEIEDTAAACLRFESGAIGNIVVSLCQKPGIYTKIHIHGENGGSVGVQTDTGATFIAGVTAIEEPPITDLWTIAGEPATAARLAEKDRRAFLERQDGDYYHRLQYEEFLDACAAGRKPMVTGADGRRVVELFRAIYLSNMERRAVRLPLEADNIDPAKINL